MISSTGSSLGRWRTNAKLNLVLRVLGSRPDGYHDLESIFHSVDLSDELVVERSASGAHEIQLRMDPGLEGDVPRPGDNIVSEVLDRLGARSRAPAPVSISILKRIPLGSGLGGGSGNAAGALIALDELWDLGLSAADLALVAAEVGSDVAFCLTGGTAIVKGTGGDVTPLNVRRTFHFVLGLSFEPLSTARVYGAWDQMGTTSGSGERPMTEALAAGDVERAASLLHNDLESVALALRPELTAKKEALLEAGALGAALSGSGPTLFALARDAEHAAGIAERVTGSFDRVVTAASASGGVERLG